MAHYMKLSYDPNGNIKTLNRFGVVKTGNAGVTTAMDNLTYTYQSGSNKLTHVDDAIDAKNFNNDIDDQAPNNYTYDAIGNLIKDNAEDIQNITWNVYGKMTSVVNVKKERSLNFYYDAGGNRVKKIDGKDKATYYVRDAQGNVMAVYAQEKNKDITAESFYIYGSSRIGELDTALNMRTATVSTFSFSRIRGIKRYEMSNHLGNVMVVVSDRKVYDGSVFKADLVSTTDYYAFGMVMSDRSWNTEGYRFGFNGKENDNEVKGTGNQQDYGMRIYDPRLGRFLSVDPLTTSYPYYSPYQFAGNKPIFAIDLDGLEELPWYLCKNEFGGKPVLTLGIGKAKLMERDVYVPGYYYYNTQTFIKNSLASAYNNVAQMWNEGRAGKTGGQMNAEAFSNLSNFIDHAQLEDYKRLATDVRTYENITGMVFTAWLTKRAVNSLSGTSRAINASFVTKRINLADEFYKAAGFVDDTRRAGHLNGIDFSKQVSTTTLKAGTQLEQYVFLDAAGNPKAGNYFSLPGADAQKLGIDLNGRVKITVTLTEDTKFLKSTTGTIENWNKPGSGEMFQGGETQLFKTDVKFSANKTQ